MADGELTIAPAVERKPTVSTRRDPKRWIAAGVPAVVVVGTLAAITLLWLMDGGVSSVPTLGAALTSIGRITGLVGAFLLLVQVVLLARLPPLEGLVGFDRLTVGAPLERQTLPVSHPRPCGLHHCRLYLIG